MIDIKNLSFGYGKKGLFSELDLFMGPGNICGLLGKNGAGKTTLLKLMAGLLFPQKGNAIIMENTPSRRSPDFLHDLFFLPEIFSLPPVTPEQYEKIYSPFYPNFSNIQYKQYLKEFDLISDEKLSSYSYGQKKKFLISFGLATGCRLMLLDEPTNGLDIPSKSQFRKVLASILTDDQLIIISTHQARDLENLIDSVIILDEGRIIFNHSTEEILNRLKVVYQTEPPDPEKVLLSEQRLDGYMVVMENHLQEATNIDLETIFNTIIQNKSKISQIFKVKMEGTR